MHIIRVHNKKADKLRKEKKLSRQTFIRVILTRNSAETRWSHLSSYQIVTVDPNQN